MKLRVVSGAILRHSKIFMAQRRQDQSFPLCWETSGGKTQHGEDDFRALAREFQEEIGVKLDVLLNKLIELDFPNMNGNHVTFVLYLVSVAGDPWPREGQGMGWYNYYELEKLNLTPGNKAALPALRRLMVGG